MVHPSVRDVALFHVKHPERSVTSPQLSLRSRVRSDARPGVPCQGPEARCNPSPMRAITYGVIVNHKRSCSIGSLTAMFHVKREAGSCQTWTGVGLRECRLRGVTVRLPDMLLPAASGQFAPLATTGKGRSERETRHALTVPLFSTLSDSVRMVRAGISDSSRACRQPSRNSS